LALEFATRRVRLSHLRSVAIVVIFNVAERNGPSLYGIKFESVESHNRFTLLGKEPVHYFVLLLSLASLAVTAYGVVASLRTPIGKKNWLWAAVCFVGIGRLAINWTTGAVGFTPLWIGFPPFGAAMIPLYSPWMVYTSLPARAVVFLVPRDWLTRTHDPHWTRQHRKSLASLTR
jgi:hypothetical protein